MVAATPLNDNLMTAQVNQLVRLLMLRPITEALALQVLAQPGFEHLEIENGQWVGFEKDEAMGGEEHGRIAFKLMMRLGVFIDQQRLGILYPGDTDFILDGDANGILLQRRPDLAFVRQERLQQRKGYISGSPDLAIEIISPTERPPDIQKKLREYLVRGVQQVWHIYPETQEIVVYWPDGSAQTYPVGAQISGGELLPGFSLEVRGIFAD